MVKVNLKIQSVIILLCTVIFSSCGITRINDFSSRKYTNFKKSESSVTINPSTKTEIKDIIPDKLKNITTSDIADASNAINPQIINNNNVQTISNPEKTKTITPKTFASNSFIKKEKIQSTKNYIMNRIANKSNTTSISYGNDDKLLLLIIAILLPPLGVFLARGIGTEFWIDILLCILLWLPGIIYAILVVLDEV